MDDQPDSGGGRSRGEIAFAGGLAAIAAPERFAALCAEYGIEFEPGEVEQLGRYLALLLAANEVVNLTAVRDAEAAWETLIFDALTLLPLLAEVPDGGRVIDVGSGGGLPGMPLAIVMPQLRFTLLDATAKKAAFLRHAASDLGLGNVEVVCGRAETLGASGGGALRDQFDAVVSRAVGRVATLAELCVPLACEGGVVLMTKGEKAEEEMAEAKRALHMLCVSVAGLVETPTGRVVVLEKRRPTPLKYPRADGEPKRKPL